MPTNRLRSGAGQYAVLWCSPLPLRRSCSVQTPRFADSESDRVLDDERQLNASENVCLARSRTVSGGPAVPEGVRDGRHVRTSVIRRRSSEKNELIGMGVRELAEMQRADAVAMRANDSSEVTRLVAAAHEARAVPPHGRDDWVGLTNAQSGIAAVRSRVESDSVPWQA